MGGREFPSPHDTSLVMGRGLCWKHVFDMTVRGSSEFEQATAPHPNPLPVKCRNGERSYARNTLGLRSRRNGAARTRRSADPGSRPYMSAEDAIPRLRDGAPLFARPGTRVEGADAHFSPPDGLGMEPLRLYTFVIPGLVPGIHSTACAGVCGALHPPPSCLVPEDWQHGIGVQRGIAFVRERLGS